MIAFAQYSYNKHHHLYDKQCRTVLENHCYKWPKPFKNFRAQLSLYQYYSLSVFEKLALKIYSLTQLKQSHKPT